MDDVVAVTHIHRKAAIRLLRRAPRPPTAASRAGRPPYYGPDIGTAAAVPWQASGRIGAAYAQLTRVYQLARLHVDFFTHPFGPAPGAASVSFTRYHVSVAPAPSPTGIQ